MTGLENTSQGFPRVFWTANVVELFERAAYYSMASFVVIYLGQLGLGSYWPSTINGLLWTLIYFLPVLSGAIADRWGFRRSLLLACALLAIGYVCIAAPIWSGKAELSQSISDEVTAGVDVIGMVMIGIVLVGVGGSFVKPCISGTVQKTAKGRATLAFAIFYMVVNIGSLTGRGASYVVRTGSGLPSIFAVASIASIIAFLVVLLFFREPETVRVDRKSIKDILLNMVLVLKNLRFALFLLAISGFWFLYTQVYNVLPLYVKRVVENDPAMDLYTMANPLVIVAFQLLITRLFGRMKPIRSIMVGIVVIALAMLVNLIPLALGDLRSKVFDILPIASLWVVVTVALIAFGELFASARMYEYIGALAPKGQEGLYLGYASLPTAIGALLGGSVGAAIFNEIMAKDAKVLDNGLLELVPAYNALGFLILMAIGLCSALGMWFYNRWIERV